MKEKYEEVKTEVIVFEEKDVITTSGCPDDTGERV